MRSLAAAAVLLGLAVAANWSVRLGMADYYARQETVDGTEKALGATPDQAAYYFRLGLLLYAEDNARSTAALQRAVALNPCDARSWIELGLQAEANGDQGAAERYLLRAAEEDKQYFPRWTLANYYFRRNEVAKFWLWAKASAEMSFGDAFPLFRLCGKVAEDGRLIERIGLWRPEMCAKYLWYLLAINRFDLIMPAVRRVLEADREADVPALMTACDRLLDDKRLKDALEIWNWLAERRRIPFGKLDSAGEAILTNGNFAKAPISHGFDWRLPQIVGVNASAEESPAGLRLAYSGRQSENCEALIQFVPLLESTAYELEFVYRTSNVAQGTGLGWRITDGKTGRILAEVESLSSASEKRHTIAFTTPRGCHFARLALAYRRASGTTRIEGFIVLRGIALKKARKSLMVH